MEFIPFGLMLSLKNIIYANKFVCCQDQTGIEQINYPSNHEGGTCITVGLSPLAMRKLEKKYMKSLLLDIVKNVRRKLWSLKNSKKWAMQLYSAFCLVSLSRLWFRDRDPKQSTVVFLSWGSRWKFRASKVAGIYMARFWREVSSTEEFQKTA